MRIGTKYFMLVLVLSYSAALSATPTSGARVSSVMQSLAGSGKGMTRLKQAATLAVALLATAPAAANAQELLKAEDIRWMDVAEAHHSATIALQSMPEEGTRQRLLTLAYIGDTDLGDAVLVGLTLLPLGEVDTDASYTAYSTDGMLADNVRVEQIASFDIDFEGFSETTVVVAKGLSLSARYEPLRFMDFPLDDVGGELAMVTY